MTLLTAGYWQTTYWAENYWNPRYWPHYGVPTIPPGGFGGPSYYRGWRAEWWREVMAMLVDFWAVKQGRTEPTTPKPAPPSLTHAIQENSE